MKTLVQLLVSGVLVATAFGCAANDPKQDTAGDQPSDRPGSSSTPGQTTAPEQQGSKQAVSVTFRRSGGLKPTDETLVFAADKPAPSGRTKADVRAVLESASDPALIKADLEPLPKNLCCDRQTYVISIAWDDGSSRTYQTIDGVQQPQIFEEFLSNVA